MANNEPKQVLIWRSDVRNVQGHKVRTGKIAAQLAHASLKALLDGSIRHRTFNGNFDDCLCISLDNKALKEWISGRYAKISVSVDTEQELIEIYNKAKEAGLLCSLIVDAGLTEFGGISTHTAVAIGPAFPEEIDPITSHLKLL